MKPSCKDLGGKDCTYTVEGKSADEVKRKMWEHARRDHSDVLAGMDEATRKGMEARMDEVLGQVVEKWARQPDSPIAARWMGEPELPLASPAPGGEWAVSPRRMPL